MLSLLRLDNTKKTKNGNLGTTYREKLKLLGQILSMESQGIVGIFHRTILAFLLQVEYPWMHDRIFCPSTETQIDFVPSCVEQNEWIASSLWVWHYCHQYNLSVHHFEKSENWMDGHSSFFWWFCVQPPPLPSPLPLKKEKRGLCLNRVKSLKTPQSELLDLSTLFSRQPASVSW